MTNSDPKQTNEPIVRNDGDWLATMDKMVGHKHKFTIPVEWRYEFNNTYNSPSPPHPKRVVATVLRCECGEEVLR